MKILWREKSSTVHGPLARIDTPCKFPGFPNHTKSCHVEFLHIATDSFSGSFWKQYRLIEWFHICDKVVFVLPVHAYSIYNMHIFKP